jgi:hypothetical protein
LAPFLRVLLLNSSGVAEGGLPLLAEQFPGRLPQHWEELRKERFQMQPVV